jgi:hypothetical protein
MKNEFDALLQRKMDRKDFMKHLAIGFVALTGLAAVLKSMNNPSGNRASSTNAYGASMYGGNKK